MSKCKRASQCLFWPNITNDIEQMVRKCGECSKLLLLKPSEPLETHHEPSTLWTKVGSDLFDYSGYYITNFIGHVPSHFLQSTLHCSCFISFPSMYTSSMLYFISFSSQSISFISSTIVHLIHIYHLPSHSHSHFLVHESQFS